VQLRFVDSCRSKVSRAFLPDLVRQECLTYMERNADAPGCRILTLESGMKCLMILPMWIATRTYWSVTITGISVLLATATMVTGQVTYHVAVSGNDSPNDGLSWASPFLTIHHAITQATDNDTILVSNGTYLAASQINLTKHLTIQGYTTAADVIVDAGGTGIGGQSPNPGWSVFLVNAAGARIENLTIKGGAAWWGGNGAGMTLQAGTVSGCIFRGNYAGNGGALYMTGGVVTNSLFHNNGSYQSGGGIYMTAGTLTHCTITSNRCERSNGPTPGGGIYMTGGLVKHCIIRSNWSRSTGGGIHISVGQLINSLITGNEVRGYGGNAQGGGIYQDGGNILHVTVADNLCIRGSGDGFYQTAGTISNSISYYNGDSPLTARAENLYQTGGTVLHSCMTPLPAGTGNIQTEPLFVDRFTDDYRLHPGSPCIDTGTSIGILNDLTGALRPQNGGSGSAIPDMGCYEAAPPSSAPSLSCDFRASTNEGLTELDVVFTAGIAGPDTSISWYSWSFGNGVSVSGPTRSVVTNHYTSGWYDVTLTVTNASLATATQTRTNHIKVVPATVYASRSGSHTPPYLSWATAATNIRSAVAMAWNDASSLVLITNGTYGEINRIDIKVPIRIRSINGASVTTVDGQNLGPMYDGWSVLKVDHAGAVIEGLRITRGANYYGGSGAGVYLANGTLTACDVDNNFAGYAGGIRMLAGTVTNCTIRNNQAYVDGGGIYMTGGLVTHCTFTNNRAFRSNGTTFGGAVYTGGGILKDSTLQANWAMYRGGAVYLASGLLRNCLITTNRTFGWSEVGQGGGIYQTGGQVESCTVADNNAYNQAGDGVWMTGGTMTNSIVYYNGSVSLTNTGAGKVGFSCFTPAMAGGSSNLLADPAYLDRAAGDYSLRPTSPCINAGSNQTWMAGTKDLQGSNRIEVGIVDMGCYEASDPNSGPLACDFTADQTTGYTNLSVVFSALVSGSDTTIVDYAWDLGNGTVNGASLAMVTNQYSAGYYTVSLTVRNLGNETNQETKVNHIRVSPAVAYVAPGGTHVPPFLSWSTASTTIVDAVNEAYSEAGQFTRVLVTNGRYVISQTINVFKDITIESVNGKSNTVVSGNNVNDRRVFYINSPNALLEGFTITEGSWYYNGYGAGLRLDAGTVRNCTIVSNYCGFGGGIHIQGGTLESCSVLYNRAYIDGGGIYQSGGLVQNCILAYNRCIRINGTTYGGGVFMSGGVLRDCELRGNTTGSRAGAVYLSGATAAIQSCTMAGCSATGYGGTGYGGGLYLNLGTATNCIIYGNQALTTGHDVYQAGGNIGYSCATDLAHDPGGSGNITNLPGFVDPGSGYGMGYSIPNLRLTDQSPCYNTGTYQSWMAGTFDLDGALRIQRGGVDRGCYELAAIPGSIFMIK